MYCQKCGHTLPDNALVCPDCGEKQKGKMFCQHCGKVIDDDCVVCPQCGKQVKEIKPAEPQVVINNTNNNSANAVAINGGRGRMVNKWVAFLLCLFLGYFGAHKFYEGKVGMGILYLFTLGLFGIGWIIDIISILLKPNPYD